MARPLRLEFSGAPYHVMAHGNERKPICRDGEDRRRFIGRLASEVGRSFLLLHAFVFMREHYHLQVETGARTLKCRVHL